MRGTARYILLLPMLGLCCPALPQVSQQPSISIEAGKPTFELGQPIQIHIILKNTTDREFTVFRSTGGASGEEYYSVGVIGPDGKPAALTEYGAAMEKYRGQLPILSRKMVHVAPGGDADDNVTISRMFNMTAAGTYVVQVSRPSPLNPTATLKSNKLTISVIKPGAPS
jgi:hypothetical protein